VRLRTIQLIPTRFSQARLAIINPLPYFRLAKFIVDNQTVLLRKAADSHLTLGKVVVSAGGWLRRANRIEAISQHRATPTQILASKARLFGSPIELSNMCGNFWTIFSDVAITGAITSKPSSSQMKLTRIPVLGIKQVREPIASRHARSRERLKAGGPFGCRKFLDEPRLCLRTRL
jgi:hypothetical protein